MSSPAQPHSVSLEEQNLEAMFQLTLGQERESAYQHVANLDAVQREEFLKLADSHHVVLRSLLPVAQWAAGNGKSNLAEWAKAAISTEQARIQNAMGFLHRITTELEAAGCPCVTIKTLDHRPDLGNDLDLYTSADPRRLVRVLVNKFNAHMEPRSWGDRLANKWNFAIPGLREAVEFHVQRLGQTGEHTALAQRFISRRAQKQVDGMTFYVPAAEERIVVATLQRMYRHFYFRVCDILNSAAIVNSGELDYEELRRSTEQAGIWAGVATYLEIVSGYVARYQDQPLALPAIVHSAARFGADKIRVRAKFLRVPVMPEGAALFTRQVTKTALSGDVPATFRLNLLPPLALAAAVAYRLTGSDKGVW
jgi:hypothetical protein